MPLFECGQGGYKWGESGTCFTGPEAKEKALAVGRAIKAADKGLILGDAEVFKATEDKTTGFLTSKVKLARTGVQHYMGFELGLADRALEKVGVLRHSDEVFHPDSIKSFVNLIVTNNHPNELVGVDNVKKLQMGTVSEVSEDRVGEVLSGIVTITDKDQIKKLKDGKVEVSVGYENDLIPKKGIHDGVKYEFAQTKIRANHLAIVDAGRCGPACKITMDNKKEKPVKITIDGIEYDVEDAQLAQAIRNQQTSFDAENEGLKEKLKKSEEDKEEMEKKKDKAEASKDAMAKTVLDDSAINTLVSERATLLTTAQGILKDKMPECTDCPKEIKTAVIDAVLDMGDLSTKSADYIDAAYDLAVKKAAKAKDTLDDLGKDFQTKDGKKVTRESARQGYMKDQLKIVEG